MKQQNGIILVTALLLLFTLALLSLGAMTTSQLQLRMSHNSIDALNEFQITESALNNIEKKLTEGKIGPCRFSPISKEQGKIIWLTYDAKACSMKQSGVIMHYMVEDFSDEICVSPVKKLGKYYRITVWPKIKSSAPSVLQSIYVAVNNDDESEKCKEAASSIQAGRCSWRELTMN